MCPFSEPPSFQPGSSRRRPRPVRRAQTASPAQTVSAASGASDAQSFSASVSADSALNQAPQAPQAQAAPAGQSPRTVKPTSPDAPPSFAPQRSRDKERPHVKKPTYRRSVLPGTQQAGGAAQPPSFTPKASNGGAPLPRTVRDGGPALGRGSEGQRAINSQARTVTSGSGRPSTQKPFYRSLEEVREKQRKRKRRRKVVGFSLLGVFLLVVALVIAWPFYLMHTINGEIQHVDALSSKAATGGETWLIAGSDARGDGIPQDGTSGQRADTIMLIHTAPNGQSSVISIPRDSAAKIPGFGLNKINASLALGGPQLLVKTVENMTGMKVDHFVEVTMGGVVSMVDAVGGINVCYDHDANDHDSGMVWKAGCHTVNGQQALAFSRMRHQDPLGDIGRAERQRQVLQKVVAKATDYDVLKWPSNQMAIGVAGAHALRTDPDTDSYELAKMVFAYRDASKAGMMGTPPIRSMGWSDGIHGSMVLLDPDQAKQFWNAVSDGTVKKDSFGKIR